MSFKSIRRPSIFTVESTRPSKVNEPLSLHAIKSPPTTVPSKYGERAVKVLSGAADRLTHGNGHHSGFVLCLRHAIPPVSVLPYISIASVPKMSAQFELPAASSAPAEEKTVHCVEGVSGIFTIRFKKAGLLTKVIFFHDEKPAHVSR